MTNEFIQKAEAYLEYGGQPDNPISPTDHDTLGDLLKEAIELLKGVDPERGSVRTTINRKGLTTMTTYKVSFELQTEADPSAILDGAIELARNLGRELDGSANADSVCFTATESDDDLEREAAVSKQITPEFLWSVFVTALEGGIGYWSECLAYKPFVNGDPDHDNFRAVVQEYENGEKHAINADVIRKGIRLLLSGQAKLNGDLLGSLTAGVLKGDSGYVDAEVADCVAQVGLFDTVVYG